MKKWWVGLCAAVLVCIAVFFLSDTKRMAVHHVTHNQEKLAAYAESCMEHPEDAVQYGEWETRYDSFYHTVVFQVSYTGFASEYNERGFYFSPDDQYCCFGNDLQELTQENGIKFVGKGDNCTYVEKILDHWYWYEIHW